MYAHICILSLFVFVLHIVVIKADDNPHHRIGKRVIGGDDAPQDAKRFLVQLVDQFNRTICTGSIIAPDTVLTAAHCL